ncbi:MAG: 3-deoxy-7-phosphoheptulonate synthase [Clostridia bacterium]|nr:3-deoxy-7-phosphoheptulonate synthase [Clostridia bacterium]
MVIVTKNDVTEQQIESIAEELSSKGLNIQVTRGEHSCIIGLCGDVSCIDPGAITSKYKFVEQVLKVSEPYKKANRRFKPENTIIKVGKLEIGNPHRLALIAGPCSVESEEQICFIAEGVKSYGAKMLRGGAYKPRTSPYSFQGMETEGLFLLKEAREKTGLPVISEITSPTHIEDFLDYVDVFQVGARNMQNFELLKELGKTNKPVLIKRGLANTMEELLMSAEYVMNGGNEQVILCERGIRTFEEATRNTLDISAVPMLKRMTHLPVMVDPSHSSGIAWMVEPLAKAAVAAGADGLMIEVHNDPAAALCDGKQSITIEQFGDLVEKLRVIAAVEGRTI